MNKPPPPHYVPRGVYLDLPAEEYHKDQSLSASGMKAILTSPLTYWTKYLKPSKPSESTVAKSLGTALHKAVLEGWEAWNRHYAVKPVEEDYPGCLVGVEALRDRCGQLGLGRGGTMADMARRIREVDGDCVLWPEILEQFQETAIGKTVVSREVFDQCKTVCDAIAADNQAKFAFQGGLSEVSVFWIDANGVPRKARLDYLQKRSVIDHKTFGNSGGTSVERAVVMAVVNYGYHIQAVNYVEAANAAKILIRQGHVDCPGHPVLTNFADIEEDPKFFFVFTETGDVGNVLVREFSRSTPDVESLIWSKGEQDIRDALEIYMENMGKYGMEPWVGEHSARAFNDEEFPIWFWNQRGG